MNKTELIKQVAQEANLTQKDATASVQAVLEVLVQKMPALCKL
ncbi:HU family DNA-binding protein, partial [Bacillus cereus]